MAKKLETYEPPAEPQSKCSCGHAGDGPNSEHADLDQPFGEGKAFCMKCDCVQFTWAGFLDGKGPTAKPR